MKTKKFLVLALLTILTLVVSACAPTAGAPAGAGAAAGGAVAASSAVTGTAGTESATEYTTPHPILSDLAVRKAIAQCIDRAGLIKASYDYVDDPAALEMDSFLPKTHWAYKGPYDFPKYDPEAAKKELDAAGWKLEEGSSVRSKNGMPLTIKFTTTNAQFRQTWSAVMIQQLADCGIQIIPTYAPASWWFGANTGLRHRDFELGAYAWVGESEPSGRSLYACDQIPSPSNNWLGQNSMGWCNKTASDAIIKANNTLIKEDRIPFYDTVQKEFAKDVVSIPIFQRAEVEAWSTNLEGPAPDPTEYTTWNAETWKLKNGGDTIVMGSTQEPDSMWAQVASMASRAQIARMIGETGGGDGPRLYHQTNYDFQPWMQDKLSTIEAGMAKNNDVQVKAGDMVYNTEGQPVKLEKGVKVFDSTGKEVTYDGTSTLTLKQLVVDYTFKPQNWSDGKPMVNDDFALGYKIDCDKTSGAVGYNTCDQIGKVDFGKTDKLEYTVTYLPGVQTPTYFLPPVGPYPSHQVLADGRNLKDVPAAEWANLPEIAQTPLTWGPYKVKEWVKGQSMTLEANPHYTGQAPATPKITIVFISDTQQAVAQLLNGDVDFLDKSTLGAGIEPKTVIDAAKKGSPVTYKVVTSPTWEHIDINLNTK